MKNSTVTDDGIPKWLKRGKDNSLPKVLAPRTRAAIKQGPEEKKEVSKADENLASVTPKVREEIEKEIKAHRFQRKWLENISTIRMFEHRMDEARVKKDAEKERLAALPQAPKIKRNDPLASLTIKVLKPAPRKAGTGGAAKYAEMVAWMKKNPRATVPEVFANTSYKKNDYDWDLGHQHIDTNIATATNEKKS